MMSQRNDVTENDKLELEKNVENTNEKAKKDEKRTEGGIRK